MRIVYVTRTCTQHDRRFLRSFASHGVEIGFFSLQDCSSLIAREPLPTGVQTLKSLCLRPGTVTSELDAARARFESAVRAFAPSIVLAGTVHDGSYLMAGTALSMPWVAQSWAFDVLWESRNDSATAARARMALAVAPSLFADSEAVARRCEELAGKKIPRLHLMPWGLEFDELRTQRDRDAIRLAFGIEGRKVFVCSRSMEPVYGIYTLLEAFRIVHERDIKSLLLWAGGGSLLPGVQEFLSRNRLTEAVRLLGAVDRGMVLDAFTGADCYVNCSASDGTSLSLLEALYFGLPVVVSDIGGNREWIRSREQGLLTPYGDVKAFADAMEEAMAWTARQRQDAGWANRELVLRNADFHRNFPRFLDFLAAEQEMRRQ